MGTHKVTKDKKYIITAKTDTRVVDVASGYVLAIVAADSQVKVQAISDSFTTEGECIVRPFR